ncbi:MAG TPA: hypothetical protein VFU31_12610 [Candidatus Binatia bacterium]|nr:hypothetical protein [Candidatus Binatia bacterium]
MKLSVKALILAGALGKALSFLFVALLNVIWPPYGGAYLGMMTSVYPGYRPETGPLSVVIGLLYAFAAGGFAGAIFGWLYNRFAESDH